MARSDQEYPFNILSRWYTGLYHLVEPLRLFLISLSHNTAGWRRYHRVAEDETDRFG